LVYSEIGAIWEQEALLDRVDVGCTWENVNASYAPINPRQWCREPVWHHDAAIVVGIHDPGDAKLAQVVDAANALGLELGFG
jgi:hypothetical protein